MAEYYNNGECIDGKRVLIRFKKILHQANTYIISPTGFKGTKYKCSRDGTTEITVELPNEEQLKVLDKKPTVHLAAGDRLKCNRAYFIAQTARKLNCFKVKMMSGRHECQEAIPDVRVYAEVETPFEAIIHAAENRLLEEAKKVGIAQKDSPKLK